MKVEGTHSISAPRERVWQLLNDPEVLARCTPGATRMEREREDVYQATLRLGVGPVRGEFEGHLTITEKDEPRLMVLALEGQGGPGGVRAVGRIELEEQGGATVVRYEGEPQISGRLAAVGARLLSGVAKKLAGQFFDRLEQEATA